MGQTPLSRLWHARLTEVQAGVCIETERAHRLANRSVRPWRRADCSQLGFRVITQSDTRFESSYCGYRHFERSADHSDCHPNGDRDTGHHHHTDAASEAKRHSTIEDNGGTSAGRGGT